VVPIRQSPLRLDQLLQRREVPEGQATKTCSCVIFDAETAASKA